MRDGENMGEEASQYEGIASTAPDAGAPVTVNSRRAEIAISSRTQRKADVVLALVAIAWGSSYLMMKCALEEVPPYFLIGLRFGIAFLIVALIFVRKMRGTSLGLLGHAALLAVLMFASFAFLTYGLPLTSASNAGFLIALAVVFAPVINAVLLRRLPEWPITAGVLLAVVGIALLSLQGSLILQTGDLFCLLSALAYAAEIIAVDRFVRKYNALLLGIWQVGLTSLCGFIFSAVFETPVLPSDPQHWAAVMGLAIVCSAFGFIAQPLAQRYTTADHTALLFACEPLSSAVIAFVLAGEILSVQGYLGAVLVLAGVLVASALPTVLEKRHVTAGISEHDEELAHELDAAFEEEAEQRANTLLPISTPKLREPK